MDAMLLAVVLFIVFIVTTRLITKFLDMICSSKYYKTYFADLVKDMTDKNTFPHSLLASRKKAHFAEIEKRLKELPGDILEIGAGAGSSLDLLRLPQGCSMVVVDYNPHFEQHFREKLAKHPDVKLKEYLVQSAVDMSNIPDDSFSVVFVTDVLCSLDEDLLRQMLKEIKRVLKPDGCFYFLEHVLEEPGNYRRYFQKLICWLNIWPRLFDGCHCNRETGRFIQETGFESTSLSYVYAPRPKKKHIFDQMELSFFLFFIGYFLFGHARKSAVNTK